MHCQPGFENKRGVDGMIAQYLYGMMQWQHMAGCDGCMVVVCHCAIPAWYSAGRLGDICLIDYWLLISID